MWRTAGSSWYLPNCSFQYYVYLLLHSNPLAPGDMTITSWKIMAEGRVDENAPSRKFWLGQDDRNDSSWMHKDLGKLLDWAYRKQLLHYFHQ